MSNRITEAGLASAAHLMTLILRTFFQAYYSHAEGMSEEELLIDYDIEACVSGWDKSVVHACRTSIQSAVKAVDEGVPYPVASHYLAARMKEKVERMIEADAKRNGKTLVQLYREGRL